MIGKYFLMFWMSSSTCSEGAARPEAVWSASSVVWAPLAMVLIDSLPVPSI